MPKKLVPKVSVQHIPRSKRLSSNDLTHMLRKRIPGAKAIFNHGIGWSIYKGSEPIYFIGNNWVEAHNYIRQVPVSLSATIYSFFR